MIQANVLSAVLLASACCAADAPARYSSYGQANTLHADWLRENLEGDPAFFYYLNIPGKLFRLGPDGWHKLVRLRRSGVASANQNLAYYRWKAILALGEQGPWRLRRSPAYREALGDLALCLKTEGPKVRRQIGRRRYRSPEWEAARAAVWRDLRDGYKGRL